MINPILYAGMIRKNIEACVNNEQIEVCKDWVLGFRSYYSGTKYEQAVNGEASDLLLICDAKLDLPALKVEAGPTFNVSPLS